MSPQLYFLDVLDFIIYTNTNFVKIDRVFKMHIKPVLLLLTVAVY